MGQHPLYLEERRKALARIMSDLQAIRPWIREVNQINADHQLGLELPTERQILELQKACAEKAKA